eukprot:14789-Hanusia_phi.AAC.1
MSLMINDLGSQLSFMNPHRNIYNLKTIEEGRKKMWCREGQNGENGEPHLHLNAGNGDEAGAQAEATGSPRCISNGQRQAATKETRQVKSREEDELRSRLERIEKKLDK